MNALFQTITPLVPAGADLVAALAFYEQHLGFTTLWQDGLMAGVQRGGVAFNLVVNDDPHWADNASFSIGVTDLDALYEEVRHIPAEVGPLESKAWGRREFHVIVPSGVCLQFHQHESD